MPLPGLDRPKFAPLDCEAMTRSAGTRQDAMWQTGGRFRHRRHPARRRASSVRLLQHARSLAPARTLPFSAGAHEGDTRSDGSVSSVTKAQIVEEITARLGAAVPPRSRVVLFGSQARGDAHGGSDFDVLIIEPAVADVAAESVRLDARLRGLGVPVDVVVLDAETARQHAAVRGTMVGRALREGQVLVES